MGLNSAGGSVGAGLIQAWEAVFSQCSVVEAKRPYMEAEVFQEAEG